MGKNEVEGLGSFTPSDAEPVCFSLEFVDGQLDPRQIDESWKRYLYLAVLMGLVTAVCGLIALILSMSVNPDVVFYGRRMRLNTSSIIRKKRR